MKLKRHETKHGMITYEAISGGFYYLAKRTHTSADVYAITVRHTDEYGDFAAPTVFVSGETTARDALMRLVG